MDSSYIRMDSAVGIATGYGLDDREIVVRVQVGFKNFLFSTSSRPVLVTTQPFIQWVTGGSFFWSKAAEA
jgi:hypothetical protein